MDGIPCHPVALSMFTPYGEQMKKGFAWFPQEWCNEWPHQASALTVGESNVIKYGVSYPLRTGLHTPDEKTDFVETVSFLPFERPLGTGDKIVEEVFVSRGVCVISRGPLGGPCFLKGLYRPLLSYDTGVGICEVVKAKFPNQNFGFDVSGEKHNVPESYICLVERGGISIYAENNADTHVSHVAEFEIGKIMACNFGLLLIPSKAKDPNSSKYMFILTHPIKQVSKVWIRHRPHTDYCEYDGADERISWCEGDVCIFWSAKNDKINIRRLAALEKSEILQLSTLNATMYQTSPDLSNKGFHQSANLQGSSPLSKQPFTRSAAMKANRDAGSFTYWPTFDFGTSGSASSASIGVGFYPPHVCIYDDPEIYLKPLFQIDLPKTSWKQPRKFKVISDAPVKISLWYLIKNTLYSYGIQLEAGVKLGNFNIKNIEDFAVPTGPTRLPVVILLDCQGKLSMGWLDANYSIVCKSSLEIMNLFPVGIEDASILGLESMMFGDTIICNVSYTAVADSGTATDVSENIEMRSTRKDFVKVELKNYRDNCVVRSFIELLEKDKEFESTLLSKLLARLTSCDVQSSRKMDGVVDIEKEWEEFFIAICSVISAEPLNNQIYVSKKFLKAITTFKEVSSLSGFYTVHIQKLETLLLKLTSFTQSQLPGNDLRQEVLPLLPTFGFLLLQDNPSSYTEFQLLPEVLQILLNKPDELDHFERLVQIERTNKFIPMIQLLIADVCHRNSRKMNFRVPLSVLTATGRTDYLSGRDTTSLVKSLREDWLNETEDNKSGNATGELNEDLAWMIPLLTLQIFSKDRRLEEVCRLLDSSSPLIVETEQKAEMSDHEYVEEQEKHLLQLVQVTSAAPVGRTALTLRTDDSPYTSLTSFIFIPQLVFAGKSKGKGTSIELNETDLPTSFTHWPQFHNAVAAAMSIRFTQSPADAWFAFNKTKVAEGPEQAGMVLGFGLNRILTAMPPTLRHEYLSKENSFTTMAMLLGLAANLAGTGDISTWKLISLHIGAMLPACTTELDIPRLATLIAPASLGLLFLGTQNSYVAKVLLGEMSKKFTPLSCFGSTSNNNSTSVANPHENTGTTTDREAHSLCAGLGLGFVNLAKGRERTSGFSDDDFDGILRRFVVGGPKPVMAHGDECDERNNPSEQTLPSMWEEYRCCHIEEGDNVNVDVTTPSAIIAVALTYLRTGNEAVLNWLAPPSTLHLLDGVRPDLLMLRSLASILVYDFIVKPEVWWLEYALLPKTLQDNALQIPKEFSRLNHESINQCWASIVCGFCLGLGIRFAGTSDHTAKTSISHYTDLLLRLSSKESKLSEFFPKNFLESCICNLALASSLVLAGTGDLAILRLCRHLQRKVSLTPATASSTAYGLEMCISMATGILFLGGGRYSLSNDDKSIAMILAAVFPKWPINANDNRYHLQALRHLYILAAQPRLILPKPMLMGSPLHFELYFTDGSAKKVPAPVLLPPFYLLEAIRMVHKEYFTVTFRLPKDLPYLNRIVENGGILNLVKKPIASAHYGFVRQMSWRQETNFSPMFETNSLTSAKEAKKIGELNLVHQLAEWSGMKEIVSPVLSLLNADPENETITWQIRILQWWTEVRRSKNIPTCFPDDLLMLLRTRNGQLIDVTKPTTKPIPNCI